MMNMWLLAAVSLLLICVETVTSGPLPNGDEKEKLDYCEDFSDPHLIPFFQPTQQFCHTVGAGQILLANSYVVVTIAVVLPASPLISDYEFKLLDGAGNTVCVLNLGCMQSGTCTCSLVNPPYTPLGPPNEFQINYSVGAYSLVVWVQSFAYGNPVYYSNIRLWQSSWMTPNSKGLCVQGCSKKDIYNSGEGPDNVFEPYLDAAINAAESFDSKYTVSDDTRENCKTACTEDVQATKNSQFCEACITLALSDVINQRSNNAEEVSNSLSAASKVATETIESLRGK